MSAQFLLGKVILRSSFRLFRSKRRESNLAHSLYDDRTLLKLNVSIRRTKASCFMSYFLPEQASTSEISQTRLVHYQLVEVFLVNCSHNELVRMGIHLQTYIKDFTRVIKDCTLINYVNHLLFYASRIREMIELVKRKERLDYVFQLLVQEEERQLEYQEDPSNSLAGQELVEIDNTYQFLLAQFVSKCWTAGVRALTAKTRYYDNCLREAYMEFWECRHLTVSCFNATAPKFAKCFEELYM